MLNLQTNSNTCKRTTKVHKMTKRTNKNPSLPQSISSWVGQRIKHSSTLSGPEEKQMYEREEEGSRWWRWSTLTKSTGGSGEEQEEDEDWSCLAQAPENGSVSDARPLFLFLVADTAEVPSMSLGFWNRRSKGSRVARFLSSLFWYFPLLFFRPSVLPPFWCEGQTIIGTHTDRMSSLLTGINLEALSLDKLFSSLSSAISIIEGIFSKI